MASNTREFELVDTSYTIVQFGSRTNLPCRKYIYLCLVDTGGGRLTKAGQEIDVPSPGASGEAVIAFLREDCHVMAREAEGLPENSNVEIVLGILCELHGREDVDGVDTVTVLGHQGLRMPTDGNNLIPITKNIDTIFGHLIFSACEVVHDGEFIIHIPATETPPAA